MIPYFRRNRMHVVDVRMMEMVAMSMVEIVAIHMLGTGLVVTSPKYPSEFQSLKYYVNVLSQKCLFVIGMQSDLL